MGRLLLSVMALSLLSGCVAVQPWKRGELARQSMAWDPDPLQAGLADHVYFSKEAASGRAGLGGGGCGCN
ncbi:MAG: DUF4266 domain-containing protein [Stagnimonas sp.]|nr:DUF4266 domain-containing protein [Stagnimonas sp.]